MSFLRPKPSVDRQAGTPVAAARTIRPGRLGFLPRSPRPTSARGPSRLLPPATARPDCMPGLEWPDWDRRPGRSAAPRGQHGSSSATRARADRPRQAWGLGREASSSTGPRRPAARRAEPDPSPGHNCGGGRLALRPRPARRFSLPVGRFQRPPPHSTSRYPWPPWRCRCSTWS